MAYLKVAYLKGASQDGLPQGRPTSRASVRMAYLKVAYLKGASQDGLPQGR